MADFYDGADCIYLATEEVDNSSASCEVLANTSLWGDDGRDFQGDIPYSQLVTLFLKGSLIVSIITLTVGGNLLVLMAMCTNASLRTTTNVFIVNLALADLLLGVSVLPFSATIELFDKKWFFGQIFCNVWAAVDVLCCTASINSLCIISIDRYIGVTQPLTYSSIVTHKRATVSCFLVWILSIAISVGPLFGWKDPPPKDPLTCEVTKQTGYVLFSVAFSFYIPTIIILFVYHKIYKAATSQTKFLETGVKVIKGSSGHNSTEELTLRHNCPLHNSSNDDNSQERVTTPKMILPGLQNRLAKFKRQKKAAKTLGIVVGVFILCWFPFFFLLPLSTLCKSCSIPEVLFDIFFWTGYFNSCLNPIIYACSIRDFKRSFKSLLRCQCMRPRPWREYSFTRRRRDHRLKTMTIKLALRPPLRSPHL
ncbi:ADRA1B [Cordylochernes scorpioides]|uniref:ADRA1B n=1 Tax=Cordylochernes scorpioides TaxID=51811 RepID=A0ABY6K3Y4_9ARAC|nr:ADRA1B [Cordylochernes scorpioides]